MGKRNSTTALAFARFMRSATSVEPSPYADVPARRVTTLSEDLTRTLLSDWRTFRLTVNSAFEKMPACERAAFAAAILYRAYEWQRTPAGDHPRMWPIRVAVEPKP